MSERLICNGLLRAGMARQDTYGEPFVSRNIAPDVCRLTQCENVTADLLDDQARPCVGKMDGRAPLESRQLTAN